MDSVVLLSDALKQIADFSYPVNMLMNTVKRLAIVLEDFYMIFLIDMMQKDYTQNDVKPNLSLYSEIAKKAGEENCDKAYKVAREKMIKIRTIEFINDKGEKESGILGYDFDKIVEQLSFLQEQLSRNILPSGLTPLDMFYVSKDKQQLDIQLGVQIQNIKTVLSRTRTEFYEYLISCESTSVKPSINAIQNTKKIFIVHGHDEKSKYELKEIVEHDFKCIPIILNEMPDKGMTIIEKFEYYAKDCEYAFGLFTPDDIVEVDGESYFQARPNAIFEIGWFYANIGRSRTCILMKNDPKMEIFSDLQGVIQKRYYSSVKEIYRDISIELKELSII